MPSELPSLAAVAEAAQARLAARLERVTVDVDLPNAVRVVFDHDGQRYGWRYVVSSDDHAVAGSADVIAANVVEFIEAGLLSGASAPDPDGIAWLS